MLEFIEILKARVYQEMFKRPSLSSDYLSAISPVPGGVGPMTVAQLVSHTLRAAEASLKTGGD